MAWTDGLEDGVAEGSGDVPMLPSEADGLGDWRVEDNGLLDEDAVGEADEDPLAGEVWEEATDGLGDGVAEGFGDCPLGSSEADGLADRNEENNGLPEEDRVGEAEGELL